MVPYGPVQIEDRIVSLTAQRVVWARSGHFGGVRIVIYPFFFNTRYQTLLAGLQRSLTEIRPGRPNRSIFKKVGPHRLSEIILPPASLICVCPTKHADEPGLDRKKTRLKHPQTDRVSTSQVSKCVCPNLNRQQP